jgi:hypothetical protein
MNIEERPSTAKGTSAHDDREPYRPTVKELEGDKASYCYMQQDSWSFPEQMPFISKPEETHDEHSE